MDLSQLKAIEIKLAFWKKSMVDFLSCHFGCLIRIMGSQVTGGLEIQKKTCERHIQTLKFAGSPVILRVFTELEDEWHRNHMVLQIRGAFGAFLSLKKGSILKLYSPNTVNIR